MKKDSARYYDDNGNLIITAYRMNDLAAIYGVGVRTVSRWVQKLAPAIIRKQAKYFGIKEVTAIIEALGVPQKI